MAARKSTKAAAIPSAFLEEEQHNLEPLVAADIYRNTVSWLKDKQCLDAVPDQVIIQYSMAAARWQQAEQAVSQYGMIGKGKAGEAAPSPFVSIAGSYQRQSMQLWAIIGEAVHRQSKETAKPVRIAAEVVKTAPAKKNRLAECFDT